MLMLRLLVALAGVVSESATCTVKIEFPAEVGVPVIVPPLRLKPGGRLPELTLHLYGDTPPVAPRGVA
jgi:hypothetical protein